MERLGHGVCHASFGELLQGVLPNNKKFLVNFKVQNISKVTLRLTTCQYSPEKETLYAESYKFFSKSYKIIRNILSDLGRHDDFFLEVNSDIPVGKGLSSSTADMVASSSALATALSIALKKEYISRMLTEIEPNDGLHYPGTSVYHHTTGTLIAQYNWVPPLYVLGIDSGGTIDTVKFNQTTVDWQENELNNYQYLLLELEDALVSQNVEKICMVATESTCLWQKINPKPFFDDALDFMQHTGGIGLVNAHSGTFLGILYHEGHKDRGEIIQAWGKTQPSFPAQWFKSVGCRSSTDSTDGSIND